MRLVRPLRNPDGAAQALSQAQEAAVLQLPFVRSLLIRVYRQGVRTMNWLTLYRIYKVVEAAADLAFLVGVKLGEWYKRRRNRKA